MGYYYRRFADESVNKLYELLEDVTPLEKDCGVLCRSACCAGGDRDGMILFPGEESFFAARNGFSVFHHHEYDCDCVVCGGSCHRADRPLSCRIYPYFFYANKAGGISVAPDVRALGNCPLAEKNSTVSPVFLRAMRLCAKVIEQDETLFAFTQKLTDLFVDFGPLTQSFRAQSFKKC